MISNVYRGLIRYSVLKPRNFSRCSISLTNNPTENIDSSPKGGFAKAFDKQAQILQQEPVENQTFASLLRNSKLIDVSLYIQLENIYFYYYSYKTFRYLFSAWRSRQ